MEPYTKLHGGGFSTRIQKGYVEETLEMLGMENCKGARTPGLAPMNKEDMELDAKKLDSLQHGLYRKVVGNFLELLRRRSSRARVLKMMWFLFSKTGPPSTSARCSRRLWLG